MMVDIPEDAIDLGNGHWFTFFGFHDDRHYDAPEHAGIIDWHYDKNGHVCGGAVHFWRPPGEEGPIWQVHGFDPLTVMPSIHCTPEKGGCGSHGWIRDGKWEDAAGSTVSHPPG